VEPTWKRTQIEHTTNVNKARKNKAETHKTHKHTSQPRQEVAQKITKNKNHSAGKDKVVKFLLLPLSFFLLCCCCGRQLVLLGSAKPRDESKAWIVTRHNSS